MSEDPYVDDDTLPAVALAPAAAAYAASDSHALGDLALEPFTSERFVAAQSMGLRWPMDPEHYRQDGGLYQGEVHDAALVLFLCTLPSHSPDAKAWSVRRALRQPGKASVEALRWATEQGFLAPDSAAFWQAITVFEQILIEIVQAYREPIEGAPPHPK